MVAGRQTRGPGARRRRREPRRAAGARRRTSRPLERPNRPRTAPRSDRQRPRRGDRRWTSTTAGPWSRRYPLALERCRVNRCPRRNCQAIRRPCARRLDGRMAAPTDAENPFRYSAALAADIEARWQDEWESAGTFEAPNPSGPLGDPDMIAGRPKLFLLDMFPYPSGSGLHVGHPLGYIGTDVFGRFRRMKGYNVLHALGYDAFGLPAEQYAIETGTHPRVTTEQNIVTYRAPAPPARSGPRPPPFGVDLRRVVLPLDAVDLPADLQLVVRPLGPQPRWPQRRQSASDRRADRRARVRSAPDAGRARLGRPERRRAPAGGRRPPPGLRQRGPGQLVPGSRHRARQRGGHRRRHSPTAATSPCSSATCASG